MLGWLHDLPEDPKETVMTVQDVDQLRIKFISHGNTESSWVAPDGRLGVPECNLNFLNSGQSTVISLGIFVRGAEVGLTHTKNLMTKEIKLA